MAKSKKNKKRNWFLWILARIPLLLLLLLALGLGFFYFGGYADKVLVLKQEAQELVAESDEQTFVMAQSSTIYDSSGNVITETSSGEESYYVAYEDIPSAFVDAITSIEDKKFFTHNGVDYKAVLRAVKAMIVNGKVTQGASTITMQLAKLTYLQSSTTWQYKIEQMFIALELESKYTKEEILEFYLNDIYFANNYYGIQAACYGYFNCELDELSLSQIAFLCAIPNSPMYYDPLTNMDHTLTRRDLILENMLEDGKITQEEYEEAVAEEIVLDIPQEEESELHNYVDTYVYNCAIRALMEQSGFTFQYYFDSDEEEEAYNEEYDELYANCRKKVYTGGYQIYTSIDMEMQQLLQDAVDEQLAEFTEIGEDGVYEMQGAAVCIDNSSGYVVAIVGGRDQDFSTYTLNRAYQSYRQPGSSIKPLIVYTPAFEQGYTPDSKVVDEQFEGGPSNSGDVYYGTVTIRKAVTKSLNTVAWKLFEEITPEVGLSYLLNMNFSQIEEDDYTAAASLGGLTTGVSPLEMAAAYATLVNDGVYRKPTCVVTILDSENNIVYTADVEEVQIYERNAARMMTDVLTTVMESGTGSSIALDAMPCAGKTGTTNSQKDGWFVGYTRYYTTSVWVGYDTPQTVEGLTGSSYPGYIWNQYMEAIHENLAEWDFEDYETDSSGSGSSSSGGGSSADTGSDDLDDPDADSLDDSDADNSDNGNDSSSDGGASSGEGQNSGTASDNEAGDNTSGNDTGSSNGSSLTADPGSISDGGESAGSNAGDTTGTDGENSGSANGDENGNSDSQGTGESSDADSGGTDAESGAENGDNGSGDSNADGDGETGNE